MSDGSGSGHILRTALILVFSLAVVVLGANDLHKKHFSKFRSKVTDPNELIRVLRDDRDLKQLVANREGLFAEKNLRVEQEAKAEHSESLKRSVEKLVP